MTDIVERLRDAGDHALFEPHLHHEAADEIERFRRRVNAAQCVIYEAYWHLAYNWQGHLKGDLPVDRFWVDMSIFDPDVVAMMTRSEQELHGALKRYAETQKEA